MAPRPSLRPTIFSLTIRTQKQTLTPDALLIIQILNENNLGTLASSLFSHKYILNLPAISYLVSNYDRILNAIKIRKKEFQSINAVEAFTKKTRYEVVDDLHIPTFNLYHYGASCHLNSCINILSSLSHLILEMNHLRNTSETFNLINTYILNSFSEVDLNVNLLKVLALHLNLNINNFEEAPETMKTILRILYENGVSKTTIFYWDSTDEFQDEGEGKKKDVESCDDGNKDEGKKDKIQDDESFGDKICHYNPKYLLMNVHDMNCLLNYDTDKVKAESFNTKNNHYRLTSLISYNSFHFVSMFIYDDNLFKVCDDLSNRFEQKFISSKKVFSNGDSHVVACYMREELTN